MDENEKWIALLRWTRREQDKDKSMDKSKEPVKDKSGSEDTKLTKCEKSERNCKSDRRHFDGSYWTWCNHDHIVADEWKNEKFKTTSLIEIDTTSNSVSCTTVL